MTLTVPQVRDYLRYDHTDNDPALAIILDGAKNWVERYTAHLLTQRTVSESFPAFRTYHDLRWKPYLADSLAITYRDGDFAEQTFADTRIYASQGTFRVSPATVWPTGAVGATLTYTAGYETADEVPDVLIHALAVYAGMSDEDRATLNGDSKHALNWLLEDFRLPVLA